VKKTGVKEMKNVVENSENVENANVGVERKTESGQNGNQAHKKNIESLAKIVAEKLMETGLELGEISELSNLTREIVDLNVKIQKLSEERLQKISQVKEIYERLDETAKKILELLGLLNVEEVERVIGKTHVSTHVRASNGNGLTGKKINFKGQIYNIAAYFMRKYGIQGGFNGLQEWVAKNGYNLRIDGDTIYIT
jgi:hypothetical protein